MIYSVHFYYHKRGSRKAASKFEGIVFAKSQDHAEGLVKKMVYDYPIEAEEPEISSKYHQGCFFLYLYRINSLYSSMDSFASGGRLSSRSFCVCEVEAECFSERSRTLSADSLILDLQSKKSILTSKKSARFLIISASGMRLSNSY